MGETAQLTFEADDQLDLKSFSEKLEKFLLVEHGFVEGSLVVSLNAPFGAGKTYFLSMWKSELDKRKEADPTFLTPIILNAWESDYCGDPLLSIVNALVKATSDDGSAKDTSAADRIREAAKDVGWFVTGLANNLASQWTGFDPVSAAELAESKRKGRKPEIPDFVALYQKRTESLTKLKITLRDVFGGDRPKAFLFVDELDRCRPDYAINYLETIKHVFDIHGLVFVLAVDRDQLECSAKALFGADLKFSDYFRKFVQRSISLPEPEETNLEKLALHYVSRYLNPKDKRISLMHIDHARIKNITKLLIAFRMPPRQIQETFRIIGHTVTGDAEHAGRLYWGIGVGVILMSALKVAEPSMYRQIGNGTMAHREVGKFLIKLLGKNEANWWFWVYLGGSGREECKDIADVEKLIRDLEFVSDDSKFDVQRELSRYSQGWGHYWGGDHWQDIYKKIETANTF